MLVNIQTIDEKENRSEMKPIKLFQDKKTIE